MNREEKREELEEEKQDVEEKVEKKGHCEYRVLAYSQGSS